MVNVQWKSCTFAPAFGQTSTGEMVEWSITVVLKTTVPRGTGGSNPSLSASKTRNPLKISGFFISPFQRFRLRFRFHFYESLTRGLSQLPDFERSSVFISA